MNSKDLPKDWNILKFKDCVIQLCTGLNPRDNFSLGHGKIKYITAKNLVGCGEIDFSTCDYIDEEAKQIINKRSKISVGDILFSSRAPIGQTYLITVEPDYFEIGESIFSIRVNKKVVTPEYLCLYLSSDYFIKSASKHVTGSVIQEIRVGNLMETDIIVPPIEEQKKITGCIDSIDYKVRKNNSINSELESLAKTIYDYWFIQFEFPNDEGKPYKSSGGKMVWNEELKREIPEGWKVKPLCSICNFVMGQSPKGKSYNVNGIGYPLINGAVELNKNGITIDKYTDEANRLSSVGDWLFCIRATIGNVQMSDKQYALGRGVAGAHPKNKKYTEYLYMIIIQMCEYFSKILVGSIIAGMTKDDILNYPVIIPSEETISEFHTILSNSFIKKECLKQENQELASLRDFLLPMLMNGQVTFKDK